MSITVDTRRLDMILQNLPRRAEQIIRQGAVAVEGRAVVNAPVDTGALMNSITINRRGQFEYWVQDGVEYGIYQELGTSRMRAQPFMRPAVEAVRPQYNASWRELFDLL